MKNKDNIIIWLLLLMSTLMLVIAVIGLSNEGWTLTIGSFACLCMALFFILLPYHIENTRKLKKLEKELKEVSSIVGGKE